MWVGEHLFVMYLKVLEMIEDVGEQKDINAIVSLIMCNDIVSIEHGERRLGLPNVPIEQRNKTLN